MMLKVSLVGDPRRVVERELNEMKVVIFVRLPQVPRRSM